MLAIFKTFILSLFFHFTYQPQSPLHPLLLLPLPTSPHPTPYPLLSKGKASYVESTKLAILYDNLH